MSRHQIPARDPRHEVYIGWDHPMLTYFGQVYSRTAKGKRGRLIYWIGTGLRELYEIDELAAGMKRYADIPLPTRATLYGDKDEGR